MKEHPILFSTPMIQAILSGAKSQTRRVIKPQPIKIDDAFDGTWEWKEKGHYFDDLTLAWWLINKCSYGQVGDRLWVREKALYWDGGAAGCQDLVYQDAPEIYALLKDNELLKPCRNAEGKRITGKWTWKPSIFMPRWASRITLEITGIRVERLQEIWVWVIEFKRI